MNVWTVALLLALLPPTDDLPAAADAVTFQALKDTAHLLDLWSNAGGHWGTDYASEVRWVQRAFADCHDAPHVGDVCFLPVWALIDARLEFNTAHERWLLDYRWARLYAADDIDARLMETRRLRLPWELMRVARGENSKHDLRQRRFALKQLREVIGEEAYYSGAWPPWVPPFRELTP